MSSRRNLSLVGRMKISGKEFGVRLLAAALIHAKLASHGEPRKQVCALESGSKLPLHSKKPRPVEIRARSREVTCTSAACF